MAKHTHFTPENCPHDDLHSAFFNFLGHIFGDEVALKVDYAWGTEEKVDYRFVNCKTDLIVCLHPDGSVYLNDDLLGNCVDDAPAVPTVTDVGYNYDEADQLMASEHEQDAVLDFLTQFSRILDKNCGK